MAKQRKRCFKPRLLPPRFQAVYEERSCCILPRSVTPTGCSGGSDGAVAAEIARNVKGGSAVPLAVARLMPREDVIAAYLVFFFREKEKTREEEDRMSRNKGWLVYWSGNAKQWWMKVNEALA